MLSIIIGVFAICAALLILGIRLLRKHSKTKKQGPLVAGIILIVFAAIGFIGLAVFCWLWTMPAPDNRQYSASSGSADVLSYPVLIGIAQASMLRSMMSTL